MPSKKKIKGTDVVIPIPNATAESTVVIPIPNATGPVIVIPLSNGEQGTCVECRHMLTGSWRGPTCLNKQSPKYSQRVKDAGTCDFFGGKGSRAPEPVIATEGLYDPEPRTDLQELLDRETEARDD